MAQSSTEVDKELSGSAKELLEQLKKNREEDGIVEIKEAIPSDIEDDVDSKSKDSATELAQKLLFKQKKRSTMIRDLCSKDQSKRCTSSSVMGVDSSWWDQLEKEESRFVNDYRHKLHNIDLMQKYETMKDPSPLNPDNRMGLHKDWDEYLWKESIQQQEAYLHQKYDPPKALRSKEEDETAVKSKEAKNGTKKKKKKKKGSPAASDHGQLVGFFNKPKTKKKGAKSVKSKGIESDKIKKEKNPYLDNEVMKGFDTFSPDQNQHFEQKFNPKDSPNAFSSVIIPSDEFASNPSTSVPTKCTEPIPSTAPKSKPKMKKAQRRAFSGEVFERKPPDIVYATDSKMRKHRQRNGGNHRGVGSASNVSLSQNTNSSKDLKPKKSLFRQRMQRNDALHGRDGSDGSNEAEQEDDDDDDDDDHKDDRKEEMLAVNQPSTKRVRFADEESTEDLDRKDIRLIFLDVDGVLNCSYSPALSRPHLLRLKEILHRVRDCKICISSTWRCRGQSRYRLMKGLEGVGIDVDSVVIGDTPILREDPIGLRPTEIKMFLENDGNLKRRYNVVSWCAIDDIPLHTVNLQTNAFMKDHFVQTNITRGLTAEDMESVVSVLNAVEEEEEEKKEEKERDRERVKVLFLDVDGVLNYTGFDEEGVNGTLSVPHLRRLKSIIDGTGCKLVLSSAWRLIPSAKEQLLRQLTSVAQVDMECIIGETPNLGSQIKKPQEICKWLEEMESECELVGWVVLDDLPIDRMGTAKTKDKLKGHCVKTTVRKGLSDVNVKDVILKLNGNR